MKRIKIISFLVLTGCSSASKLSNYQNQCEQTYTKFSDMVQCLKSDVKTDNSLAKNSSVKLYLLEAESLSDKVKKGEVSDIDARLQLQNKYITLKNAEDKDKRNRQMSLQRALAISSENNYKIVQPPVRNSVTTDCTNVYNGISCVSR